MLGWGTAWLGIGQFVVDFAVGVVCLYVNGG